MKRIRFGELVIEWDASALAHDPVGPVLPLALAFDADPDAVASAGPERAADLSIHCVPAREPGPDPASWGAQPLLYHTVTRDTVTRCFTSDQGLVLWDGASTLRILDAGRRLQLEVHPSSSERAFNFGAATVMMALLLALRHHGYFHVHASAAQFADGETWVVPGESGAGKSTLAVALFAAGARWLSDDALLLRAAGDAVEIVGWSRKIRMTAQTAAAYPALRPLLTACPPESQRQWELDPRTAFPGRGLRATATPPTLIFPAITGAPASSALGLNRAEAFGRLLHACAWVTLERIPEREAQLAVLTRFVDRARAFEVGVGTQVLTDPAAAVAELRALLR